MELRVRAAVPADAPILADFNARMAWETENRQLEAVRVRAGVEALLDDPAKGLYFVAETALGEQTRITGQLLITYEWSDWRNATFWWIQSVYVAPEFRGQGVFRGLYGHVARLARGRRDVCGLRLYVERANQTAQQAYARLGMIRANYEMFELDFVLPATG